MNQLKYLFILIFCVIRNSDAKLPIVLWHGVGMENFGEIEGMISDHIGEDVYVKSVRFGVSSFQDFESGIFVHPNQQIDETCHDIMMDHRLKDGFHAVGFSQGSQFL